MENQEISAGVLAAVKSDLEVLTARLKKETERSLALEFEAIAGAWKGEAAREYLGQSARLLSDIQDSIRRLKQLENKLGTIERKEGERKNV